MMIRKAILATALAAATAAAVVPSTSFARDHHRYDRYERRGDYRDDYRYRCRKGSGTTGLLLGGVAGALLGRAVDTRGDRAPGTIIGAGAGALAGRAIDRNSKC
ncbi:glycine zipper 2TM domain-containing protein [Sphingobium amiense]|uniref:17 kDa surface antigen n=1 Tax=Sphingobium amiense TaxID=135719 RepID=A0A494W8R6_9SPHN|nr:glycine zipper 2TM domain-containing protein [Sphingobium amiense]BBD96549.1 glycine zipper 2TM domain-containing protein [Sphingobium amiense]